MTGMHCACERQSLPPGLTPGTTLKKLPWLDGEATGAASSLTSQNYPSSSEQSFNQKSSVLCIRKHPAIALAAFESESTSQRASSLPAHRKRLVSSINERRVLAVDSPLESSSSSVARHQAAQQRQRFTTIARNPTCRAGFTPHEQQQSISIGNDFEAINLHKPRTTTHSFAPLSDHSERSSTLSSIHLALDRGLAPMAAIPVVVTQLQTSPSGPRPARSAFEWMRNRRTSNAIEDLEYLVQDAVEATDVSVGSAHAEEIHEAIDDARQAIHASSNDPRRITIASSPLAVSDMPDEWEAYGGYPRESSSARHKRPSPPVLTVQKDMLQGSADLSGVQAPAGLHQNLTSVDRYYESRRGPRSDIPSSSRSTSQERYRPGLGTQSDLLLSPDPSQHAPREHLDYVLRPKRELSRGRSHQRTTRKRAVIKHRSHRHRRLRSRSSPSQSDTANFVSVHNRRNSSDIDLPRESYDEGCLPRPYGGGLHIRSQAQRHVFSLRRHHRRQPIARNWGTGKKRLTAAVACINTALLGIVIGVYAGEVPRIQYYLADENHISILGNVVLYVGLAVSTCVVWPLPLLHGRKPYILAALTLALPLQFPQAMILSARRSPSRASFRAGLLLARSMTGLVLGFANVNYITVLLDLFGASLQSKNPHQEYVIPNDVRRHGGGMGLWLGIWSWCWIASLAVGFMAGAVIIEHMSPDWGFYVVIVILSAALVLNVVAPETRRAAYRKSVTEVYDYDENYITRRVSRGECKLHISTEGPKYWFEEVWAGVKLMVMMMCQPGFFVLAVYLAWIYTQVVLVIVLLGSLLSRNYKWQPRFVGAGVMSIAIGAFLALPLTKANIFSRERKKSFRTDSMTFQKQLTWSSHLVRRTLFTIVLPLMGLAYTVSSAGRPKPYMVPIVCAGALGFFSILAIAECHGIMMETFDTCDLQPGVNTKHRLESMAVQDRRRRTNYSSFPRVTAGIFASQSLAFLGGAVATEVGGIMTRRLGAQTSTGVTAGILLLLTIGLTLVLVRFRPIQVIPNHTFGTRRDTTAWKEFSQLEKMGRGSDWKAVVIGNPSGKIRRMNVLELGALSRWTEIRKLNFLIKGPRLGEVRGGRRARMWRDGW